MPEDNPAGETGQPEASPDQKPARAGLKPKLLISGGIVLLLIAVGLAAWFFPGRNDSGNTATVPAEGTDADIETSQTYWDADLVGLLEECDDSNDNVSYSFTDDSIVIVGTGLPDHETGEFPNSGNPNSISEQDVDYAIPRRPSYTGTATDARIFGISLGGIIIEPGTAERDQATGWSIEAFNPGMIFSAGTDANNAHVQPDGTYHYHGVPVALLETGSNEHSNLIGFAADGFPNYARYGYSDAADSGSKVVELKSGWQLESGQREPGEPSGTLKGEFCVVFEFVARSGDLDRCNGRFTVTPEFPGGTYAYFFTEEFPFAGRCVMGELAESFNAQAAGSQAQNPGSPRRLGAGSLPPNHQRP